MIKDKLHTISDEDAKEVALILLKSARPLVYEFVEIKRQKYEVEHGVDAEESVNVYLNSKPSYEAARKSGWKDSEICVQLVERDRYHDHPYFSAMEKHIGEMWNSRFLDNQIAAFEFLKEKQLL